MRESQWIVYVTTINFSKNAASSKRIINISKSLTNTGYKVLIISQDINEQKDLKNYTEVHPNIFLVGTTFFKTNNSFRYIKYIHPLIRAKKILKSLDFHPKALFLYGGYAPYIILLKSWTKKSRVPFFFDSVEWYTPVQPHEFIFFPRFLMIEISIRFLLTRMDGILSISSSFHNYFLKKNVNTIQVPPLADMKESSFESKKINRPLKIIYSGFPSSNKDGKAFKHIISSIKALNKDNFYIELHIVGIDKKSFQLMLGSNFNYHTVKNFLKLHGVVNQSESVRLLKQSDFAIFFRDINRINTYGFPSKFVEAFSYGIPVISNHTSDLKSYLIDGVNGFSCKNVNEYSIQECLKNAMLLSHHEYAEMQKSAFETAKNSFDTIQYSKKLKDFISNYDHN